MTDMEKVLDAKPQHQPKAPPYETPNLEFVGNVRSILADGGSLAQFDGTPLTSGTMGT